MKVYLEAGAKKAFASAVDWPGWSRGGKTEDEAVANLLGYADRYARAVGVTVAALGATVEPRGVDIVERLEGNATTDFGAPGVVPEIDRPPVTGERLDELIALLDAAWQTFARVAAQAGPRTLAPSGPRGGGRSLDKIEAHVADAETAYLGAVGGKRSGGASWLQIQGTFVAALHARVRGDLPEVGPRGGERWPARYAIRRSAWHALDHAWEIEDRLE